MNRKNTLISVNQTLTTVTNHLRNLANFAHARVIDLDQPFHVLVSRALTCTSSHTSTYTPRNVTRYKRDATVVLVTLQILYL